MDEYELLISSDAPSPATWLTVEMIGIVTRENTVVVEVLAELLEVTVVVSGINSVMVVDPTTTMEGVQSKVFCACINGVSVLTDIWVEIEMIVE